MGEVQGGATAKGAPMVFLCLGTCREEFSQGVETIIEEPHQASHANSAEVSWEVLDFMETNMEAFSGVFMMITERRLSAALLSGEMAVRHPCIPNRACVCLRQDDSS